MPYRNKKHTFLISYLVIVQSPIMQTTVTLARLKKAGYISFIEVYKSVSPIFENRLIPVGT